MTHDVREYPILFSAEMVRAILDGRKTQARRVIRCPRDVVSWAIEKQDDGPPWPGFENRVGDWEWMRCPYGQPGDRLWVRETWAVAQAWDRVASRDLAIHRRHVTGERVYPPDRAPGVWYRADGPPPNDVCAGKWRSGIHMPRWASRITPVVADVRVERVQDISTADIAAEGVDNGMSNPTMGRRHDAMQRMTFQALWDSINARRGDGWDVNPWVWRVEFEPWKEDL